MGKIPFVCMCAALAAAPQLHAGDAGDSQLQEIVVTATLRDVPLQELPGSVSVLGSEQLRDAGQQHFEDVLPLIPNLNWAGDTSRPRYFQIRGIGELQQYQGAPNPSVGFLIDDIDFSGLGSAATLFDVDQIEVLHGPQSTLYGANALAGLIYVKSAAPSATFGGRAELDVGDYGERSYGAVVTGPVDALDSAFRLAVQRYTSNGFYQNDYLHRDDTDDRDELTLRARWRFAPSEAWRTDVSVLRAAMNNGYDGWSIYGTRTTESDQPSVDRQYSTGASVRSTYTGIEPLTLVGIGTYADSVINYGYDGDWGNPMLWAPYTYEYSEYQVRHRSTRSLEFRLSNTAEHGFAWLAGVYAFELHESLTDSSPGLYIDPYDATQNSQTLTVVNSDFRSRSGAVYAQLDGDATKRGRWSIGVRGERHTSLYSDVTSNLDEPDSYDHFAPADDLWGGHASFDYRIADGQHVYALLSRGYKASGFNLGPGLPADQLQFTPEWDLNYEIGHKASLGGGRLQVDTSLFYMVRHHEQLLTGEQLDPNNPDTFVFYTGNSRSGFNYGMESTAAWAATSDLQLGASLGLLQTLYRGFVQNGMVLPDRALPNAAPWQAAINATWHDARGLYVHGDVTGMGSFFYDLPPNWTRSHAYGVFNGKVGWKNQRYEIYLWGRNLLDKNYPVRGFYFGDVPPNFPTQLFVQLGEPRNVGVHFTVDY